MSVSPWHSFSVYYEPPLDWFDVVKETFDAIVSANKSVLDDWFFIRYFEGGAHVRIRLGPTAAGVVPAVLTRLRQLLIEPEVAIPRKKKNTSGANFDSRGDLTGKLIPPGTIIEQPYVAETQRYGGPNAMAISEGLFCRSTMLAVSIVTGRPGDVKAWRKHALDMMLSAATVACPPTLDRESFFRGYAEFWSDYLHVIENLSDGQRRDGANLLGRLKQHDRFLFSDDEARTPAQRWAHALLKARYELEGLARRGLLQSPITAITAVSGQEVVQSIAYILGSQIHMMSNRLGVFPREEMIWSAMMAYGCRSVIGTHAEDDDLT